MTLANSRIYIRRCIFIAVALVLWFWTQSLIGARGFPEGGQITDVVHQLTAPLNQYLAENHKLTAELLIASSLVIDLVGIFLLTSSIFGQSLRPFLELLIVFALRQACQGLTALPPPAGMLWFDPGFPSLLVTYGVSSDLFFSGHTAIAVIGGIEIARLNRPGLKFLGMLIPVFEATTVLLLRAHYFMDVFTGVVVAILIAQSCKNIGATNTSQPQ